MGKGKKAAMRLSQCAPKRQVGVLFKGRAGNRALVRAACDQRGQATVEAAFALPIVLMLVLLLVQPGIILYDRIVMESAAAEGCRLMATKATGMGVSDQACENYLRRRLGAVPQIECFHAHEGGCSWEIETSGGESSSEVQVSISTKLKPLPLIDAGATLLGLTDGEGFLSVKVSASALTQPSWVFESSKASAGPASWVGAWLDE